MSSACRLNLIASRTASISRTGAGDWTIRSGADEEKKRPRLIAIAKVVTAKKEKNIYMAEQKWKRFEKLAYEIQKDLAPNAEVKFDEKILGVDSGVPRQVDISIRQNIGQMPMLIVMDCKDHKDPVDVKDMEAFAGEVRDVRAHKGVMISSNGCSGPIKLDTL